MQTAFSLTKDQQKIFDKITAGQSAFVMGVAGTGKSTLIQVVIRHFEEKGLNILKCAPNVLAAQNINGVTIHRAFGIRKSVLRTPLTEDPKKIPEYLDYVDVILFDEIENARRDLFEYAVKCIMEVKLRTGRQIQIIVSGDYSQLPPVVEKELVEPLCDYYGVDDLKGCYAFQSELWKQLNLKTYILSKILRQDDEDFIQVLELARKGQKECIPLIVEFSAKEPIKNAITLVGTNDRVKALNAKGLAELDTPEILLQAEIEGRGISPSEDTIAERYLKVKIGARVMLTVDGNDVKGVPYFAGNLGTITNYKPGCLTVKLDSGAILKLEKKFFPITGYTVTTNNAGKKVISILRQGAVCQYPICLGYAITIHKSEGLTFDKMNFEPLTWLPGQFYVAISRCRSIKDLYISGEIKESYVKAQKEAIDFVDSMDSGSFEEALNKCIEDAVDKDAVRFQDENTAKASADPSDAEAVQDGVSEDTTPAASDLTRADDFETFDETSNLPDIPAEEEISDTGEMTFTDSDLAVVSESFMDPPGDISDIEFDIPGEVSESASDFDKAETSDDVQSVAAGVEETAPAESKPAVDNFPKVKTNSNMTDTLSSDVKYIEMKTTGNAPSEKTFAVSDETWKNWLEFTKHMPQPDVAMDEALNLFMKMSKENKIRFIISF